MSKNRIFLFLKQARLAPSVSARYCQNRWSLAPVLDLTVGCSSEPQKPEQAAQTFHEVMTEEVDVRADAFGGGGNAAIGEKGGIDPAKMSDADWDKLAEGATSLQQAALKIAAMDPIVLTRPGVKILDEDEFMADSRLTGSDDVRETSGARIRHATRHCPRRARFRFVASHGGSRSRSPAGQPRFP